jgi:hypothetical protein
VERGGKSFLPTRESAGNSLGADLIRSGCRAQFEQAVAHRAAGPGRPGEWPTCVDLGIGGGYAKAAARRGSMTTFDKREDGFEKKFAHDAELQFKAEARRNKLLGTWAAQLLGKKGADADAYVRSVIESDFEKAGDDDVFAKIRKDFDAAKVAQSDHQIRRTMDEMMQTAIAQIRGES